jgi:hypothetical protein
MKHFRNWTEGKNPFLASTALNIASFPEACFELLNQFSKEEEFKMISLSLRHG